MRLTTLAGLAIVVALAQGGAAYGETAIIEPAGAHFPYQAWTDDALVSTPNLAITVVETSAQTGCPGSIQYAAACAVGPPVMSIFIAPEAVARGYSKETFYHELGHFFDYVSLAEWERSRFMTLLELSPPWRPGPEDSPTSPDELFADVYAQCAERPYLPRHYHGPQRGGVEYGPIFEEEPIGGRVTHNRICRMLDATRLPRA